MLRDLAKGDDAGIAQIVQIIEDAAPDILILTDIDYDHDLLALKAFADLLTGDTYLFATIPNAGMQTGLDIDGNGYNGDARDAQGYGRFAGDGGMAIISRYPIATDAITDYSTLLWRDLGRRVLPQQDGTAFLSDGVLDVLRLSSSGHWMVPVTLPDGPPLTVLAFAATPPVFDGPEDMNGLRSRDELRLWENILDGALGNTPASFVVAGNSNLDPGGGDGDRAAMAGFLARADLQDPHQGSYNADWGIDGPGQLRVSYVLPSTDWEVLDAGTVMPDAAIAGPHGLVWVEISRKPAGSRLTAENDAFEKAGDLDPAALAR